ncbi:MAG: 8-oxoguanine glycosylase/AP lyase [Candidatus Poribacteria bacterium]|nr:8-oxoguanine glycosylase/AP lyase [Candidatus Poribacteria bacterium]
MLTKYIDELKHSYELKKEIIKQRIHEFENIYKLGDEAIFTELCFCIFTAGSSARAGLKCIDAIKDIILTGSALEFESRIQKMHRYPKARSEYIVHTRNYLHEEFNFKIKDLIESFDDKLKLRDFFATNKGIKGLGYKEASHFLRNIGFKGYAILDIHILRSLHEFGIIDNSKPPSTRNKYLETETKLKEFAKEIGIDFDELDLLLWSNRTGEVLK